MPSFHNAERNYVITTSLKVMYSTLLRQPCLRPVPRELHACLRTWAVPGIRRYVLVRNPYERLVSFHADKFRSPAALTGSEWQLCQRLFFPALGLTDGEPPAVIGERLRALSFEHFATLLPQVYDREQHLWPQHWNLRLRCGPVRLPTPVHRILKMEEDQRFLSQELGLDLTIHANANAHPPAVETFTSASYAPVNAVYRRDFERFGYPQTAN